MSEMGRQRPLNFTVYNAIKKPNMRLSNLGGVNACEMLFLSDQSVIAIDQSLRLKYKPIKIRVNTHLSAVNGHNITDDKYVS